MLFGLCVLGGLFLVPRAINMCPSIVLRIRCKYILFFSYLGGVLWLTLGQRIGMEVSQVRLKPFYVIRQMLNCGFGFKKISVVACRSIFSNSKNIFNAAHTTPVEDLFLNIILFIPFGFLLPYIAPKLKFKTIFLMGFACSCTIEIIQLIAKWGCCDIDDVINNTLGTCIGYLCYRLDVRLRNQKQLESFPVKIIQ